MKNKSIIFITSKNIKINNFQITMPYYSLFISLILLFLSGNVACEKIAIERIAHAGGGIEGNTYTNSFQALDFNIQNGFTFFEIDFSWTKDGQLVCIHDWEQSFQRSFGFQTSEKPSLDTFMFLVKNHSPYHKCTLEELSTWMRDHPQARIVTDIKEDNVAALQIIAQKIDNFQERVIPQCYFPENYVKIQDIGYQHIIWTLYLYEKDNDKVLATVETLKNLFAVTMPIHRAKMGLGKALSQKGIASYVHTINTVDELNTFQQEHGITEIYTDFLSPKDNLPIPQGKITVPKTTNFSEKNCMARYSSDGKVYIPCASISHNDNQVYEVHLQQQSPELFKLKQIKKNPLFNSPE